MQNVKDDYSLLENNVGSSKTILDQRKKTLPMLEKEMTTWKSRKDFLVSLDEKRQMERDLRDELCWALVGEAESEMASQETAYNQILKIEERVKTKLNQYSEKVKEGRQEHNKRQDTLQAVTTEFEKMQRESRVEQERYIGRRRDVKDLTCAQHQAEDALHKIRDEQRLLKKALSKDHDEERRAWQQRNEARLAEVASLETELEAAEATSRTAETHAGNLHTSLLNLRETVSDLTLEEKGYLEQARQLRENIKKLGSKGHNKVAVFGAWLPRALQDIERAHQQGQFHEKPIGPLGAYIEVTDSKWAHIAEKALGGQLTTFRCHSWDDCKLLKNILKRHSNRLPNISVAKFSNKVHNVAPNETHSRQHGYRSLWSILRISDPVAANAVIDGCSPESTLLIPTPQAAGALLKSRASVPAHCKLAFTLRGDKYLPDPNFRVYGGEGEKPPKFLAVSVQDHVKDLERGLASYEGELARIREEISGKRGELRVSEKEHRESVARRDQQQQAILQLKSRLGALRLQGGEEPLPPDTQHLQEEYDSLEQQAATLQEKLQSQQDGVKDKQKAVSEAMASMNKAKKKVEECQSKLSALRHELVMGQETINQLIKKKEAISGKHMEEHSKLKAQKKVVEAALGKVETTTEAAAKIAPTRVATTRPSATVKKQLESLSARLRRENEKLGSVEEVTRMYKEKFKLFQKAKSDISKHTNFIKKLQDGYNERIRGFDEICKYHAIYLNTHFEKALRGRGLEGMLEIDFKHEKLNINTRKSGAAKTTPIKKGRSKRNNLAMMSGGERSFITVSFMLALWETIYSPVRMLDEFDVFMDIVSRNVSMDMMIQAAQPRVQYVYLTPLNVNKDDRRITVFRMPDPDRTGQE